MCDLSKGYFAPTFLSSSRKNLPDIPANYRSGAPPQIKGWTLDLALFNLVIDSKLRGCDVVALRVEDVAPNGHAIARATGRPVRFELPVSGLLMPLSLRERLTMLMPPSVFYRQRIAQETRTGEPELAVLAELVPRGGILRFRPVRSGICRDRSNQSGRNNHRPEPPAGSV
jgi:hypothetical protein